MSTKRTTFGIIFLTLFLDLLGFSLIFPVFAHLVDFYQQQGSGLLAYLLSLVHHYFAQASDDQAAALFGGVLFGAYAILQFIMSPIWGILSDRFGRRPILLVSVAGNAVSYLLWVFAGDFIILLISRLMAGAMSGNISTASAAMADITSEEERAKGMGIVGAAIGLGFLLGPALGGLTYTYLPQFGQVGDLPVFALNPFSSLAICASVLSLINFLWVLLKFVETNQREGLAKRPQRRLFGIWDKSLGEQVVRCNVLYLSYMVLFASMESTLVFLAKERLEYSPGQIAFVFVLIGVIGVLIQGGFIRKWVPKYGERKVLLAGIFLQVPGYLCLAIVGQWSLEWCLWFGAAALAAGSACMMPSLSSIVSRNAAEDIQGKAMGVFRSVGSLGRALGPFLGALCYFLINPAAPYVCGAVAIILPLCLAFGIRQPDASNEQK